MGLDTLCVDNLLQCKKTAPFEFIHCQLEKNLVMLIKKTVLGKQKSMSNNIANSVKDAKIADDSFGITGDELYHKLKATGSMLLLDLRDKKEYESRHIQGAVPVSSYHKTDLGVMPNIAKTDKEIILICQDGSQSSQYAKLLSKTGIRPCYLIGGMDSWNYSLYHPSYKTDEIS